MGANTGALQALSAGLKVPALFFLSLLVCFPAFFILQYILGSTMGMAQMLAIILSGLVLDAAIFAVAGLFGMMAVLDALWFSRERKGVYPKTGVVVFRFWVIILAFVGIQLAWNLRPFLARKGEPYALFRSYEGNFYAAVLYSIGQLTQPDKPPPQPARGTLRLFPDSTAGVR